MIIDLYIFSYISVSSELFEMLIGLFERLIEIDSHIGESHIHRSHLHSLKLVVIP